MEPRRDLLVIGIGNADRGDDAVGLAVAHLLQDEAPRGVKVLALSGDGAALIDSWKGADTVFVVDAASSGAPPGTIHRFDACASALPAACFRGSTHAFNLPHAIGLARVMKALPSQLWVYGIEGENFRPGAILSTAVAVAALEVIREIGARCALLREEVGHA